MKEIINIGIVAHADAGQLRTLGSVDGQNAQTDWLDIERQRDISVKASSTCFVWQDCQINLIDTPGYVDFAGEVQRSLSSAVSSVRRYCEAKTCCASFRTEYLTIASFFCEHKMMPMVGLSSSFL